MLQFDLAKVGDRLFEIRNRRDWTQLDVASRAGISEHTYLEIERGTVRTRIDTFLNVCNALNITPDVVLTTGDSNEVLREKELLARLRGCTPQQQEAAFRLLETYLQSLE